VSFATVASLIDEAVRSRATPAATIQVGAKDIVHWEYAAGTLTYDPGASPAALDTSFDLASLTKVIATTSCVMDLVRRGRLNIDAPVSAILPAWRTNDRAFVTIRQLLDHSSGLPARVRLWEVCSGTEAFERALETIPLDRAPGTAAAYSDLGFILMGFVLERTQGIDLASQVKTLLDGCGVSLSFGTRPDERSHVAPTERDPWRGRVLCGEVHDENASAMGGVAGNAGLFGTVSQVGAFARTVLRTFDVETPLGTPAVMRQFAAPSSVPQSSRALGWDTMRPSSSCGRLMSPTAIGHTGFTGTSLWIDYEGGYYVALLANRIHPTRANDAWLSWRPRIHEAVAIALGR
jgi:CubicO group peptidase (beta-lactamase class C family)